ncbi:MAG: FAD-dependent oxidoreductase [Deltaproteobacteria bacterium]|nr:FAD-dependent oxidoreductase [Deltaproteobacteria bacterium]
MVASNHFDIAVIGAGIHGAGVAQAAAAAGYSVLVLEQTGIASATSSGSTKLIHGGLRYLETGQFALVRECLRERELLLKLAPELVWLRPFYIPVYRDTWRRPWQLRLGLGLYAALAGLGRDSRFRCLPARLWHGLDGLETRDLEQVFQYWDAQTDDAALTHAVMHSAQSLGAELHVPAIFTAAELRERDCIVDYMYNGSEIRCTAGVIVNASGAWVNDVLKRVAPAVVGNPMDLVQGAHIVVNGKLHQGIYYLEAPRDRRAVFAMPWKGNILVGTTETPFRGDPAKVAPLPEEQNYLLETLGHYFPAFRDRKCARVVEAFAALRVLPAGRGTAFRRTRETVLHGSPSSHPRLLTVYGGKLTAYRATAQKIIERLCESLPSRPPVASTRELPLTPG